jgi:hypothetical protein
MAAKSFFNKIIVFWSVIESSLVNRYQDFGKKLLPPFSGQKNCHASSKLYAFTSHMVIIFTFTAVRTFNKTVHQKVDYCILRCGVK